jgi:hypothetical protein
MTQIVSERLILSIGLAVLFFAGQRIFTFLVRRKAESHLARLGPTGPAERGAATILYFWSTGCSQCKPQEMHIEAARGELTQAGIPVVIRKHDALAERSFSDAMQVMTVPTIIVLDRQGNIAAWNPGLTSSQKLVAQVRNVDTLSANAFDTHL